MISRVAEACARNRGLVLAGVGVAALASVWAAGRVRLDALPDLSDPQVIVVADWPGRSPVQVEEQVTFPLVSALVASPRVADVRGFSMFGMTFVHAVFEEGTDLSWARSRVVERLASLSDRLPGGVSPRLGPDATGVGWILQYVLVDGAGLHELADLRAYQDGTLRHALGSVPGVAEVATIGGQDRTLQVTLDPLRLHDRGLGLEEVLTAVREAGAEAGGGVLELAGREVVARGRGALASAADLELAVVRPAGEGGGPVLLRDVARVGPGPAGRRGLLDWNGEGEAVGGVVVMRQGENAREVIARVKDRMEALRPGLPPGVRIELAYDRSGLIDGAVATLRRALTQEALVVAAVILLFLLHGRSALIPILSLPVVVGAAFIPMALLDVPATIMSLGGIAIALGASVDAEIVMVEACHKKLEGAWPGTLGESSRRALLAEAAREVTPALFFSLLVVAAAFLPVFALTGQAGRLFAPLAWTKTFVMLSAALLSITFAPALRDLLCRGPIRREAEHPVSRAVLRVYRPFVYVALRRPRTTLLLGGLAILSAAPLWGRLGSEFMPPLREGDLLYMPTTLPGISVEEARRQLQAQDRVLRSFPEVESVFGKVGRADTATDPAPLSMVETTLRLRPPEAWRQVPIRRWHSGWAPAPLRSLLRPLWPEERRITWEELVAELNAATAFPGWSNAYTMPIQGRLDMLATGVRTPVGVKVLGSSLAEVDRVGLALERLLAPIPGARSTFYERSAGGLYLDVTPRREALARAGVTVGALNRVVEAAVGGTPAATGDGRSRFTVNVRHPQHLGSDPEALRRLPVPVGRAERAAPQAEPMGEMAPGAMEAGMPHGPPRHGADRHRPRVAPELSVVPLSASSTRGMAAPADGDGAALATVPLGELAEVRLVAGPSMIRDEGGLLAGLVYLDLHPGARDLGSLVREAQARVDAALASGTLRLAPGQHLEWTGQYRLLTEMERRMRMVVPTTLLLVALLLWMYFRNLTEVLVVLLSVPFALVGSVWLLWLLDYRLSTAVWVGLLALVGLAAQTGVVMIVYIDRAYERRQREGRIREPADIVWAHLEGTVQRVRPKLMTVTTMLAGLLPLLWATGAGADVMKRIAAPMVGGLVTSAFLTLEIIPVVYTAWRQEQLLWERLEVASPPLRRLLGRLAGVQRAAWLAIALALALPLHAAVPGWVRWAGASAALAVAAAGAGRYAVLRKSARQLVWPAGRGHPIQVPLEAARRAPGPIRLAWLGFRPWKP